MIGTRRFFKENTAIYFFSIFASLLLSLWLCHREAVINRDAICYLLSAQTMGQGGLKAAMHLCGQASWPFYSSLIYLFTKLSHFSYTATAFGLDACLTSLSVLGFLLIVKELGANQRILWFAALTILLSHQFNSIREYIIRDHGFWAFYLLSVLFLLRFYRSPDWKKAAAFSMSLSIATLFRIEGAIFLLALPFSVFFYTAIPFFLRCKLFLMLNTLLFIIVFSLAFFFFLHPQETLASFGRLSEIPLQLHQGIQLIFERYAACKTAIVQHVLTSDSARDANLIFILIFIAWYVLSLIENVSWIYAALIVYAWQQKKTSFQPAAKLVLVSYLLINFLITFGFLAERLFLSKRYLIAFSLILMLFVPFALETLWREGLRSKQRLLFFLAIAMIGFSSLGGLFNFGYSKSYIHEAGNWLAIHVPANASLYANDYQLMYYSAHFGNQIFSRSRTYHAQDVIAGEKWKQYDYLAFRIHKGEVDHLLSSLAQMKLTPLQTFSNQHGDRIVIYKTS